MIDCRMAFRGEGETVDKRMSRYILEEFFSSAHQICTQYVCSLFRKERNDRRWQLTVLTRHT